MNVNGEIARIFNNIARMLDIADENPFKIRAYKNASRNILQLNEDLSFYPGKDEIENISGIGKDLAKKIKEFIDTSKIQYYEDLKEKIPECLLDLLNVQGIGPKLLRTLYEDFGVRSLDDLEKIIDRAELREVKGIGSKKIKEIKIGIKLFKFYLDKTHLGFALQVAEMLRDELIQNKKVVNVKIVGELRRGHETVESIELVVCSDDVTSVKTSITRLPFVKKILKDDKYHLSLLLDKNIMVKIDFSPTEYLVSSAFISTGSKEHVERIKELAIQKNIEIEKSNFNSEADLYKKLNMPYIPPEIRENKGEIELSISGKFGELIELKDIRGDLHTHSTWSDGRSTIKEMAIEAKRLGYEYIAVTDHSVSSRIANGLDIDRLNQKWEEVKEADMAVEGIRIIMGSEVDIKPDGELDYTDEVLKKLDMVVVSVHSNFKMNGDKMTERITTALSNPYVAALGHPTGRLIGERNPYDLDIDEVINTALKHGKALEVNSSFMRLDLKDEHVKKAVDKGVKLIISTDAHHIGQLAQMRYGVTTARRGWAKKDDVVNTAHLQNIESWINNFR